ncbi:MAG TPA: signal peptidase I [Solirubrobacteraceae bacterium]
MIARAKSRTNSLVELVVIVAVALGLALLIQWLIVKPYKIPSGSMEPTLAIGQRVLVDRIGMNFGGPKIGDIVVFHPPEGAEEEICGGVPQLPHRVEYGKAPCDKPVNKPASVNFIKRVVAGPGDWIYVKEGHAYLSTKGQHGPFKREHDPYIRACGEVPECNFLTPIHIPAGHWFMMGDNRGESDDSRFWGPIPTKWIIGVAFATYWPIDRIGFF